LPLRQRLPRTLSRRSASSKAAAAARCGSRRWPRPPERAYRMTIAGARPPVQGDDGGIAGAEMASW